MKLKKGLSILMMEVILSSSLPVNVLADNLGDINNISAEDVTTSGSAISVLSNNIDVNFNITGQWDGGFNGEIIITNLTDKVIENWEIQMEFPHEIINIWNASIVSHEDLIYTIKNPGDNNNVNIPVNGSVAFGFSGIYEGEMVAPSNIELIDNKDNAEDKYYSVDYSLLSNWSSGYTAQITITNKTDKPMEGWHLSFDYDRKIDSIWNAVIELNEENHYDISNVGYNSVIPANGSITFGFMGNGGSLDDEPYNYTFILTNTTGVVNTPEIIVNEDDLGNYKTVSDNYIISNEITSVSGELKNKKGTKEFYYIISSRSGEKIEQKSIDINSEWTIDDIDLKNKTIAIVGTIVNKVDNKKRKNNLPGSSVRTLAGDWGG